MKYDKEVFLEKVSRKFKFYSCVTRTAGTLQKDLRVLVITFIRIILRMRNVSDKMYKKTKYVFHIQ